MALPLNCMYLNTVLKFWRGETRAVTFELPQPFELRGSGIPILTSVENILPDTHVLSLPLQHTSSSEEVQTQLNTISQLAERVEAALNGVKFELHVRAARIIDNQLFLPLNRVSETMTVGAAAGWHLRVEII